MDWDSVIKQQKAIEDSFSALKIIFEQAESDFKNKSKMLMQMMSNMQAQDATNMQKIHQGLQAILDSSNQAQSSIKK